MYFFHNIYTDNIFGTFSIYTLSIYTDNSDISLFYASGHFVGPGTTMLARLDKE